MYFSSIVLTALYTLSYLALTAILSYEWYYLHFTNNASKTQKCSYLVKVVGEQEAEL